MEILTSSLCEFGGIGEGKARKNIFAGFHMPAREKFALQAGIFQP